LLSCHCLPNFLNLDGMDEGEGDKWSNVSEYET
jgi:hypothetical protein